MGLDPTKLPMGVFIVYLFCFLVSLVGLHWKISLMTVQGFLVFYLAAMRSRIRSHETSNVSINGLEF